MAEKKESIKPEITHASTRSSPKKSTEVKDYYLSQSKLEELKQEGLSNSEKADVTFKNSDKVVVINIYNTKQYNAFQEAAVKFYRHKGGAKIERRTDQKFIHVEDQLMSSEVAIHQYDTKNKLMVQGKGMLAAENVHSWLRDTFKDICDMPGITFSAIKLQKEGSDGKLETLDEEAKPSNESEIKKVLTTNVDGQQSTVISSCEHPEGDVCSLAEGVDKLRLENEKIKEEMPENKIKKTFLKNWKIC